MPEVDNTPSPEVKPKRPLWLRILKWLAVTALVMVALIIGLCTLAVWILTPSRLTPLVEKVANDNMDATLSTSRVELTFWHTFPKLTLDIDSLSLVSHSLDSLPAGVDASIPAGADSLLTFRSFHGGINLASLFAGKITLYDVVLTEPRVNLVQVNDSVSNLNIFPLSEKEEESSATVPIPPLSFNRVALEGVSRFSYRALQDSVEGAVVLGRLDFSGKDAPRYQLALEGNLQVPLLEEFRLQDAPFGATGNISWDSRNPLLVGVSELELMLADMTLHLDGEADFNSPPTVRSLSAKIAYLPLERLIAHLPPSLRSFTDPLSTTMTCSAAFSLTQPWCMADTVLPDFSASISVPPCDISYQGLRFSDFTLDLTADICGRDMDSSVVDLRRFRANGPGVDVDLSAKVCQLASNPLVEGTFRGNVNIARLPPRLLQEIPAAVTGRVEGNADFRLSTADLTRNSFHKILVKGDITLTDLHANADSLGSLFLHEAVLDFGSNSRFVTTTAQKVDSLLTLSLKIDTLSAQAMGMDVRLSGLRAGLGTLNRSSSSDTTIINPFGGGVKLHLLALDSPADSLHLRLRDASVSGSLKRYNSDAKVPEMNLGIAVDRALMGQALTKFALSKADVKLNVHMRPPRTRRRRAPALPADSLGAPALRPLPQGYPDLYEGEETVSVPLDSTEKSLLRRWDFSGSVKAASARVLTPYFPLRNRIRNVDLTFDTDSVRLCNLSCTAGESDFLINGTISNLRRALIGRRDNSLGVNLSLVSDTINVNQIVQAIFSGSASAGDTDEASLWNDNGSDAQQEDELEMKADSAGMAAILVPSNLEASFSMKAANVVYSDLVMHSFTGNLLAHNGAIRLQELSASTDIGSINVEGLYSAPDSANISLGLGMKVNRFRLDGLTSLVPAIDSLMPVMKNFAGVVNANLAVTTDVSPSMDIEIPSLKAAIAIEGDSLVLLDADTFKSLSKWLLFRDKQHNIINHMDVEVVIENGAVELYPFMFDIDRYHLGVMGSNDLAMNLNYHVSVLKSPIPFKFGINVKGTPDNLKIRLGGAKIKDNMVVERQAIADNTRVNIVSQLDALFRRGVANAVRGARRRRPLLNGVNPAGSSPGSTPAGTPASSALAPDPDILTPADSLRMRSAGLID